MQIESIEQLSAWLAATDIGLLELRGPGTLLRLRNDNGTVAIEPEADAESAAPEPVAVAARSPGVFLHGHPMQQALLCAPGQAIVEGQVVGLLQIGELLLPVTAPCAGVIDAVPVAHATCVGYGRTLVELQPEQEP